MCCGVHCHPLMFFFSMQDIEIIFTYTNASGSIQTGTIRSKDLSDSWIWTDFGKYTDKWSTESKVLSSFPFHICSCFICILLASLLH